MRSRSPWLWPLSSILLGCTLATSLSLGGQGSLPAMAQEPVRRTLTVTGQGSESVQTSLTQVDLGVEVNGREAEQVQQQVARRTAAVVELLRDRNVEKLETTGIQLYPQYNYDNGEADIIGYRGSNRVRFRLPTDEAGPLIDQAIAAGANQIQGIQFVATDEALATARQSALREATEDAQVQANTVLQALNLGPQEIVSIQINGAEAPMPIPLPRQARLSAAEADVSTPVVGGEQAVEARVTLQIRY